MSRPASSKKKWFLFAVRWTIAIVGIWYVVTNISWRDRALVLDENNVPTEVRLYEPAEEDSPTVSILDPDTGEVRKVDRSRLVNEADRETVQVRKEDGTTATVPVLAVDLSGVVDPRVVRVLINAGRADQPRGEWIEPVRVVGGYDLRVPYPRIQAGLRHMLHNADAAFLWAAVLIFPMTFVITGLRWHALLRGLGINLGAARAFIINMVGAFYNTFMPGSTGGDVLKAYYAAKFAHTMRTRAVISVIVDRAIGLVALIILGGTMAAYQWDEPACRQVALGSLAICTLIAVGAVVFFNPTLRRVTGLGFFLRRMPMQTQVQKAIDALEDYRRRPILILGTLIVSFPVHMTTIVSASLAGQAFSLPLGVFDYWYIVPVVVLSGAIPISPQGAGVMEFFAIQLTRPHGCTVAQAFALAMSIRLVQIFWNLLGGIFVFRGGYHAPTEREQDELTRETEPAGGDGAPAL